MLKNYKDPVKNRLNPVKKDREDRTEAGTEEESIDSFPPLRDRNMSIEQSEDAREKFP